LSSRAGSPLEILEVEKAPPDPALRGFHLGVPKAGEAPDARELVLRGWVLGEDGPALAIEALCEGRVVACAAVARSRPDIVAGHPDLEHAESSGFEARINLLATAGEVEVVVRAVLDPTRRLPLATMRLRRQPGPDAAIAVVIPCFNQAHFLSEAIESVLGQTHAEIAIVVVDDGSSDNTVEVAGRYPGVRCVSQENRGLAAARNAGLEHVDTDLVVFLDSDDRLLPEALEIGARELAAEPAAGMAAGAWRLIGEDGWELTSRPPELPEAALPALLESCFISTPAAVIYRRQLFADIGEFDPRVSASADYDLYLRAAVQLPVRLHGEVVAEYRRHGANMTRDAELIMRSEIAVLERQTTAIQRDPELSRARERGLSRSRAYHGERMVDEIRRLVDEGRREEAERAAATLSQLYPQGATEAERALEREALR
jgi:glycosyltransferase involved in cell wall biosynthesis